MRNRPLCSFCLMVFVLMWIGIQSEGDRFLRELVPSALECSVPDGAEVLVSGKVYQKTVREKDQILYLTDNSICYNQQSLKESRLIIYDKQKNPVRIGNTIQVKGKVSFYQNARNPGNFDQKLYYQRQNIHGYILASETVVTDSAVRIYADALNRFRSGWKRTLLKVLGRQDGEVLSAVLLGDKTGIDEETKTLYQVNGIGHVLAISGLHLSFLGIGLYQILRRLTGSYTIGGIAGICFLFLYIAMIGMSVSAFRALIMFLFRVGADICGRHYDSLTALLFAAVCVLLWRPLSVCDGGFWLSFGAVLGVIIILPLFSAYPFQGFWASVSIQLMILPVLLFYFYEIPLYSVFLNLWIVPLLSILLFLGLSGSLVYAGGGCDLLLKLSRVILRIYEYSGRFTLRLPGARLVIGKPQVWQVTVYYLCLLVAVVLCYRCRRYQRIKSKSRALARQRKLAAGVLATGMILVLTDLPEPEHIQVAVLDVGQGDSIFIKGPNGGTYLMDGGSSDVKSVGKYRMEPFLKSQGVGTLDYVIVSHGDADHMNGIEELLDRQDVGVRIRTLVLPEPNLWEEHLEALAQKAKQSGIRVVCIEQGEILEEGNLSLNCVCPGKHTTLEPGNEASLVFEVRYDAFDMLLTGDVEGKGEEALIEALDDREVTVLKVAHHGSKNATGERLLEKIKPKIAIISAGKNNRYGHPHQETLDRIHKYESRIYKTEEEGAVVMKSGRKGKILLDLSWKEW